MQRGACVIVLGLCRVMQVRPGAGPAEGERESVVMVAEVEGEEVVEGEVAAAAE